MRKGDLVRKFNSLWNDMLPRDIRLEKASNVDELHISRRNSPTNSLLGAR